MEAASTVPGAALHVRLERQLHALLVVSRRWRLYETDRAAAFRNITEAAAAGLGIERASVWLLDAGHEHIVCEDLYELTVHRHSRGYKLARADYPAYFAALEDREYIAAGDAHTDAATREFSEGYLAPHGIGAMLDVPIRVGGAVAGVLCLEHVGGQRFFLADEQTTAQLLTNLASLACEIQSRTESEARAAGWLSICEAAVESAHLGVFVTDRQGKVAFSNRRLAEIWGMPEELLGDPGPDVRLDFTAERVRDKDAFVRRMRALIADPEAHLPPLRVELKDGRALEIASRPQTVGGTIIGRVWTVRDLTGN